MNIIEAVRSNLEITPRPTPLSEMDISAGPYIEHHAWYSGTVGREDIVPEKDPRAFHVMSEIGYQGEKITHVVRTEERIPLGIFEED